MKWGVIILPAAEKQLVAIKDKRISESISRRINGLENDPERQGKLLADELAGYRSIQAVGQRYRIIYKIEAERVIVLVVTIGIRKEKDKKDAYELAKRLARLGLLDVEEAGCIIDIFFLRLPALPLQYGEPVAMATV